MSEQITEKEIRANLELALKHKDADFARLGIQVAMINNIEIHKMTDLHFPLMLLLAAPKQETRGRPKDKNSKMQNWFFNMACMAKSEITGESFSYTWAAHCDRTRPKAIGDEIWRSAGILLQMMQEGDARALRAARMFELTESDLEPLAVVNK